MRKAVLIFKNVADLDGYVLKCHQAPLEISTVERSLSGFFSDNELVIACTRFGAVIQSMEPQLIESPINL